MKRFSRTFFAGLIWLALVATGCMTHKTVTPIANGYEEVSHPQLNLNYASDPIPPRIVFQYRDATNKDNITLIWPELYGVSEVVKGDLAIFVADVNYIDTDGSKAVQPRLFAVKQTALPLDITAEVVWRWSKANGKNFGAAMNRLSLIAPEENDGKLVVHLNFSADGYLTSDTWPDSSDLSLDWTQINEIVRAVKQKGIERRDLRWNAPYIGEKF